MGFTKAISSLLFTIALQTISVGTGGIIVNTHSVFKAIFGMIFLKERYSIVNCTLAFLSLAGIVLVIAPSAMAGNDSYLQISSTMDPAIALHLQTYHTNHVSSFLLGVCACFSSVILNSLFSVYSRKILRDSVDYKLTVLYPGVATTVITPLVMLISQEALILGELPVIGCIYFRSKNFCKPGLKEDGLKLESTPTAKANIK